MAQRRKENRLKAPSLKRIALRPDIEDEAFATYPLSLPSIRNSVRELEITTAITIFVGANGSGKSTILEGIAAACGFSLTGGNKNIAHRSHESEALSKYLRLGWLPKVTEGFFFRAETFFQFIDTIDILTSSSNASAPPTAFP